MTRVIFACGLAVVVVGLPLLDPVWTVRFWQGFVPLVPILLLLSPALWRNVCPLATIGSGGPTDAFERAPDRSLPPLLPGMLLLVVLIAMRASILEAHPLATSGVIVALGGVAWTGALRRPGKAGFCNTLCPILPVERIYGQAPLIEVANRRCDGCDLCAPIGCLDLNPRAATAQLFGGVRRNEEWLTTSLGVFAGALPGLIVAFALMPTAPGLMTAIGWLGGGAVASWSVAATVIHLFRPNWRPAMISLGAIAAALHLWFTLPGVFAVWGVDVAAGPLRGAALVFVWAWWFRGVTTTRSGRLVSIQPRVSDRS